MNSKIQKIKQQNGTFSDSDVEQILLTEERFFDTVLPEKAFWGLKSKKRLFNI